MFYASVAGVFSDAVYCGCSCSVGKLGDTLIVDFSGVEACECIESDPPSLLTVAQNVSLPSEWEVHAVSDIAWESDELGSFEIWTGSCDELSPLYEDCSFKVRVTCEGGRLHVELLVFAPNNPNNGFSGFSDGIGDTATNTAVCQIYSGPDPYQYFTGGIAVVSQP